MLDPDKRDRVPNRRIRKLHQRCQGETLRDDEREIIPIDDGSESSRASYNVGARTEGEKGWAQAVVRQVSQRAKDRTFAALDLATPSGPFRIGRALSYPEFNLLKGDPRVKALRKKVGLP